MTGNELLTRMTWDCELITAPLGTDKCAQGTHPSDWIHWLFAPDNPGPRVQLMTRCGQRARRFVLDSEGKEVDCPACLDPEA